MDYIPHTSQETKEMLQALGLENESQLFDMIPDQLLNPEIDFPSATTEPEISEMMESASEENTGSRFTSFLGGGAYRHYIPKAVPALISRGDFATAYTPYQAEVSQGTLQSIYEFQTLISNLTGLEIANAGVYDGATALAEGALMACRVTRKDKIIASATINQHYLRVLKTYLLNSGLQLEIIPSQDGVTDVSALQSAIDDETAGVFVQHPNYYGILEPVKAIEAATREHPCLLGAVSYPISLGVLNSPGSWGADMAVGDLQPLGIPLQFGGPYSGYICGKQKHVRQLPGRLVGRTTDDDGQTGYVLTLQTREQHIRRAKATSNICTNQALCALASTIYLSLMGPTGLRRAAEISVQRSHELQEALCSLDGVKLAYSKPYFNEFLLELPMPVSDFVEVAKTNRILPGIPVHKDEHHPKEGLLVCATEMTRKTHIDQYVQVLSHALQNASNLATV